MTHVSHLLAAALIATGFAAQAAAPDSLTLAMGPSGGMPCAAPASTNSPDADDADQPMAKVTAATNPRALTRRNACQTVPQAEL